MILESLAIGTPVISVDCETGPSELIQNEENGLLVKNYDVIAFSNAIERAGKTTCSVTPLVSK